MLRGEKMASTSGFDHIAIFKAHAMAMIAGTGPKTLIGVVVRLDTSIEIE
jgi:hypothetical protein